MKERIKNFRPLIYVGMSFTLTLCAFSLNPKHQIKGIDVDDSKSVSLEEVSEEKINKHKEEPKEQYNEGVVLVKSEHFKVSMLGDLSYRSVEELYKNSSWYKVELQKDKSTSEAVNYLSDLDVFDDVTYDYIMASDGDVDSVDISSNPDSSGQTEYFESHRIFDGWEYSKSKYHPVGGSSDVVVAVIDTGVDYNHIDLRNNIWVNTGEIPNNGIDDDGNGYVDDYYGYDFVGNDNDPMDDNGHGTHVAGIIAAENNNIGTVGVAFNCKVMCLKAGNSSGYFNNSDIAEAIQYAYMNGASVINMSFGGSSISLAVEDALENAYNQCVLVAAAGNDGLCNNTSHSTIHPVGVFYPAALPYVIGVMSTNPAGTAVSYFSNYDDTPYNKIEYETYACGEQIPSCWPNNKIARLSGTSMASPVVAGIAALLRSEYSDRDVYSNKFIQSQIVNTSDLHPYNSILKDYDYYHSVANVYSALTQIPKPTVNLHDYYIFDSEEFSSKNNGNGIIEAGETIHLAIELFNRGGVASNVSVSIDTIRNGDASLTDPYFTIKNKTISLSDIGTYSVRNCEKIYEDDKVVGTTKYFEIEVADNCPNDYLCNFNVHFSYTNGLDKTDLYSYGGTGTIQLSVSNGYILPESITVDTTYKADRLYVVSHNVTIAEGVTVIFEAGCQIQFYQDSDAYYDSVYNSPEIINYGTLKFEGTEDNRIKIFPSEHYYSYVVTIENKICGYLSMRFTDAINLCNSESISSQLSYNVMDYCNISADYTLKSYYKAINEINNGAVKEASCNILVQEITNSYYYNAAVHAKLYVIKKAMSNQFIAEYSSGSSFNFNGIFQNNVFCSVSGSSIYASITYCSLGATSSDNVFLTANNDNSITDCVTIKISYGTYTNNTLLGGYKNFYNDIIENIYNSDGTLRIDPNYVADSYDDLYPFVKNVEILNKDDEAVKTVSREEFKVRVTFSRAMDTSFNPNLYFGTKEPFADYQISGEYVSDTVWEGTYSIKAFIENGTQHFLMKNAYAKDSDGVLRQLVDNIGVYEFDIDTTKALSMDLQAYSSDEGINLTWVQDDYDTLMGYNVYRSDSKDGNYVRLNTSVIPSGENTFLDDNAEPGKTYWYTFTVVFSDMSESAPAGKVSATAKDTIAPNIYHTPVNQGYLNNNLVISCTASDNVAVSNVTLYYRNVGDSNYKSMTMLKQNNRYSATIFGSDLSLDGLEYYIEASDGVNTITKGNKDNPYSVIIKDASSISKLGDVDGDGVISTKDALMIMQAINGDLLLSDDAFIRADLNGDGTLSSVEALRILQYINGKVSTLAM